jgi:hypothetical protein
MATAGRMATAMGVLEQQITKLRELAATTANILASLRKLQE